MERMDKTKLTLDDQFILEEKVIPTAKKWMLDFGFSNPLFQHGLDYVTKWGAENDHDIARRFEEYKRYTMEGANK